MKPLILLHTTARNDGLGDTLDAVTKDLAMAFSTTLAQTLATLPTTLAMS